MDRALDMPRGAKLAVALLVDSSLCLLTTWIAISLRYEQFVAVTGFQWLVLLLTPLLALPILAMCGFYQSVIRYAGINLIDSAVQGILIYGVVFGTLVLVFALPGVPRSIGVIQPVLLLVALGSIRWLARHAFEERVDQALQHQLVTPVVIYGAGRSGQQLTEALRANMKMRVVGYIDDDSSLHGARITNINVFSPSRLAELREKLNVKEVLLAIPSLSRERRSDVVRLCSESRVSLRTIPSLTSLADGKIKESALKRVDIEDLLGRDPVAPIDELLHRNVTGKVVLVTGAGGSIGSELCRQLVSLSPQTLILIELNEYALYSIEQELLLQAGELNVALVPVLANVLDEKHVAALFDRHRPHTVYHAAAYKHVPLVEVNPIAALRNNVIGTCNLAMAALKSQVKNFVLVSTDKAVRPTNVMGASKRLAEMVLQALARDQPFGAIGTNMSVVRFGNVLGSSGSVIPKFREQIQAGGPVTVTHADVTRYFMTIPEAAQLVLQASAMTLENSCEAQIFLLDMGQSVRILDLARTMIALSGLTVKDRANPSGDIEIVMTGLRPGEKLYEELLISGNPNRTEHPKIVRSSEPSPDWKTICFALEWIASVRESDLSAERLNEFFSKIDVGYHKATP